MDTFVKTYPDTKAIMLGRGLLYIWVWQTDGKQNRNLGKIQIGKVV